MSNPQNTVAETPAVTEAVSPDTLENFANVQDKLFAFDTASSNADEHRGAFADSLYICELERFPTKVTHDDMVLELDSDNVRTASTLRAAIALGIARQSMDDQGYDNLPTTFAAGRKLKGGLLNANGKAYKLTNSDAVAALVADPAYQARLKVFADSMAAGHGEMDAADHATEGEAKEPDSDAVKAEKALTTFCNRLNKVEDLEAIKALVERARGFLTSVAAAVRIAELEKASE